ncbi:DUF3017 domain-containing protein [Nocardioides sp. YIM 152588]|uniref:DUF3017 domain-containing protein n=1 Tax=Nocardioides sp. YIM 152588 TaxID=3158259 RepID=UPI0032E42637
MPCCWPTSCRWLSRQLRPQGEERALNEEPPAPPPARRHPSTLGGAFYLAILLATGGAIGLIAAGGDWRLGIRILAGALGVAGLLRLVLPERDAGMLAVRHRLLDVVLLAGVSLALFLLASSIPEQPGP